VHDAAVVHDDLDRAELQAVEGPEQELSELRLK
jgi:hypothetical protein